MHVSPKWFVYIVKCSDGSYYTGISNNVINRINKHNKGLGAKYTKNRGPLILLLVLQFENRSEASKEEYKIKKLPKLKKINLIKKNIMKLNQSEKGVKYDEYLRESDAYQREISKIKSNYFINMPDEKQTEINNLQSKIDGLIIKVQELFLK